MTTVMRWLYGIGFVLVGLGIASIGGGYTIGSTLRAFQYKEEQS